MKLYNTLTRKVEEFVPREKKRSLSLRNNVFHQFDKSSVLFTEGKQYGIRVKATDMKAGR